MLKVHLKEKKAEISAEEQLKKDIMEKIGNPGEDIREKIEKMNVSKEAVYYNKLVDGLLSIGKKEKKTSNFEPFFVIDQIKGTFQC